MVVLQGRCAAARYSTTGVEVTEVKQRARAPRSTQYMQAIVPLDLTQRQPFLNSLSFGSMFDLFKRRVGCIRIRKLNKLSYHIMYCTGRYIALKFN